MSKQTYFQECEFCRQEFVSRKRGAKYCSPAHRQRAYRMRKTDEQIAFADFSDRDCAALAALYASGASRYTLTMIRMIRRTSGIRAAQLALYTAMAAICQDRAIPQQVIDGLWPTDWKIDDHVWEQADRYAENNTIPVR
jgi:hypothetical protein